MSTMNIFISFVERSSSIEMSTSMAVLDVLDCSFLLVNRLLNDGHAEAKAAE